MKQALLLLKQEEPDQVAMLCEALMKTVSVLWLMVFAKLKH